MMWSCRAAQHRRRFFRYPFRGPK
uniref:Uncharacterized protein n=1 Tax=Arundo donax TaxID=35708 RepID=A0A0A9ER94_ARUDO